MCIVGRVPKETSRNFWIRASVRFFRYGPEKRLRASDFPVKNEDKEPILRIFFFSFGCNELKNLKLLIYS